jgi:hypothetical protein
MIKRKNFGKQLKIFIKAVIEIKLIYKQENFLKKLKVFKKIKLIWGLRRLKIKINKKKKITLSSKFKKLFKIISFLLFL